MAEAHVPDELHNSGGNQGTAGFPPTGDTPRTADAPAGERGGVIAVGTASVPTRPAARHQGPAHAVPEDDTAERPASRPEGRLVSRLDGRPDGRVGLHPDGRPEARPEEPYDERPLWTTGDGPDDGWLLTRPAPVRPPSRVPRDARRPALGLPALVVLALLAAFFAWVSAEPLWLALGHAERGTATVTRCTGDGVTQRCTGTFTAPGFAAEGVALLNLADDQRGADAKVPALMVSPDSSRAYAGAGVTAGMHVRWAVGLLLTLLCGLGIAWATGARRLATAPARHRAVLLSLAAPLTLAAAFLALSF